jgi:YidC/Oxa1 family membrane protein insertase
MFDFLAGLLAALYKIWPSYGGAIILFTTLIMLVLSPLSIKSTRSMLAMQRVGPEIKKLQAKHKGDREALNREMMTFYQENNINPFSSCLPMLLQIPVFIVLYQVLIGLTRRSAGPGSNFDPKYLEGEDTPLAVALRGTNEMLSFGMDLSQSAWAGLQRGGVVTALPFVLLVVLVVITAVIQQRQIQGRNPAASANPQQQMIAKVMPFIFVPISVSLPAGVVIYFVASNVVRIGQQALVTRLDFREGAKDADAGGKAQSKSTSAKPVTGGDTKGNGRTPSKPKNANAKNANAKNANAKSTNAKSAAKKGGAAKKAGAKGGRANAQGAATKAGSRGVNGSRPNGQQAKPPASVAPRPRKRKKKRR